MLHASSVKYGLLKDQNYTLLSHQTKILLVLHNFIKFGRHIHNNLFFKCGGGCRKGSLKLISNHITYHLPLHRLQLSRCLRDGPGFLATVPGPGRLYYIIGPDEVQTLA